MIIITYNYINTRGKALSTACVLSTCNLSTDESLVKFHNLLLNNKNKMANIHLFPFRQMDTMGSCNVCVLFVNMSGIELETGLIYPSKLSLKMAQSFVFGTVMIQKYFMIDRQNHIDKIIGKMGRRMSIIRRCSSFFIPSSTLFVIQAWALSHIDCCPAFWSIKNCPSFSKCRIEQHTLHSGVHW